MNIKQTKLERKSVSAADKLSTGKFIPSDFPDFAEFLVKEGIDSISLNPDTVVKTTEALTS